jgi:hypothetical protein
LFEAILKRANARFFIAGNANNSESEHIFAFLCVKHGVDLHLFFSCGRIGFAA